MHHYKIFIQDRETEVVLFRFGEDFVTYNCPSAIIPKRGERIFVNEKWYKVSDISRYYKTNKTYTAEHPDGSKSLVESTTFSVTIWVKAL